MTKMSPKLKIGCKKCNSETKLENVSFKDIKILPPKSNTSKIITLKGRTKKEKTKGLF